MLDMTHIEHTVTIERPVDDVWAYVMDARNDPKWMSNVIEVGRDADRPVGRRPRDRGDREVLRRALPTTLTRHRARAADDAPRSTARGPAGVSGTGSYELEAVDGATRFTMATDTDAHGFFKLAEPVFARMARRDLATARSTSRTCSRRTERRNDSRTHGP